MYLYLAVFYAKLYHYLRATFNVNVPGLGFFLRKVKKDYLIEFRGRKMFFNHKVASSYGLHIIGKPQERETHIFFDYLLNDFDEAFSFVDVGANVGAFVIDISRKNKSTIYAFDPYPECINAIEKSLKLNEYYKYNLFANLVGDTTSEVSFNMSSNPEGASIYKTSSDKLNKIKQITLDTVLSDIEAPSIFLIDVEGYEPNVIKGGLNVINRIKPIIVFEYNEQVSKKFYSISQIVSLLGPDYNFYRLRSDGKLDGDVENAWNCVAVPRKGVFSKKLNKIILY